MGFDARFLGVEAALPRVDEEVASRCVELDYLHFTVVLDSVRRLARVTGVNVDGAALVDVPRGDEWRLDERVPADWQTGPQVYARNDLDRGHLVRRRDPVWGPPPVAARANADTFHYTNAAPQASQFNQSKELWLGLEDHVLAFADVNDLRLSSFTAPFLDPGDPSYRGIRVPLRFWKVIAWVRDGRLATAGFVLDQTPLVDVGDADGDAKPAIGEAPDLGPFRAFQVPVGEIAAAGDLAMPDLIASDRMPRTVAAAGWHPISKPGDLLL